jgi:hypothetical protein
MSPVCRPLTEIHTAAVSLRPLNKLANALSAFCTGKFVGDSKCEKLPIEICGAGCTFEVRKNNDFYLPLSLPVFRLCF